MKAVENVENLLARRLVQVARGLVGQQDGRLVDERPGDRHALLLAARQGVRFVGHAVRETHRTEQIQGPLLRVVGIGVRVEKREKHVVQDAQPGQEVEELEDEADALVADARELPVVEGREVLSRQAVAAARGLVQEADDVHERALARSRRPHERHVLALLHGEVDALEDRRRDTARVVGLLQVLEFDHGSLHATLYAY